MICRFVDEFNRLEERILSAVSQQIQIIQSALAAGQSQVKQKPKCFVVVVEKRIQCVETHRLSWESEQCR